MTWLGVPTWVIVEVSCFFILAEECTSQCAHEFVEEGPLLDILITRFAGAS